MECMALQPQYQTITEKHMIHSNLSVITNVRLDHTDVMGYTLPEIAHTLGRTIPRKQQFFSAENIINDELQKICDRRKTESHFVSGETVSTEEMKGFNYIEHRDNVALALEICNSLGIDRETALKGMYTAIPDEGALRAFKIQAFNKSMTFYNAFAANDPDSTMMIWKKIRDEVGMEGTNIVLLNTRQDRLDRARQLAEMCGKYLSGEADNLLLIGQSTEVVEQMATGNRFPKSKIINLGYTTPAKVFETALSLTNNQSTIVAIGNMGGMGAETAEYFENRSA